MNKRILALGLSSLLSVAMFAGCGGKDETKETEAVGVNVSVAQVVLSNIETTATYTGSLTTDNYAYVTSKVTAKVKTINVELGDRVEKGQVLAVLDSTDYEYQLSQARAGLNQAEAAYNSAVTGLNNVGGSIQQSEIQLSQAVGAARLAYDNAKTNFDRQKELYEMGAISRAAFESAEIALKNARLQYESAQENYEVVTNVITPGTQEGAQNSVETARAAVESARLAVSQAEENIKNTRIVAPIAGYISSNNAVLGSFASAGSPLFIVSDSADLEAEISVTEAVIPHVKVGGKALVEIASANVSLEGNVSVVNPVKNPQTGMYTVRVSVPNEDESLKIGMFAEITLYTEESVEDALCVPVTALLQEGEEYYVYTVTGNVSEKKMVTVGVSDGINMQITEGLQLGEMVVCEGKEYISEKNNIVNIVE